MTEIPAIRPERLALAGPNRDIGAALADHAARRFGSMPDPEGEETTARAAILVEAAPHLRARAEGVLARFPGRDPFSLPFPMAGAPDRLPAACPVALLPARGGGGPWPVRNFAFGFLSAAALAGGPADGVPMVAARHLPSLAPQDGGRATCGLSVFDLFGAPTCGVNDAGPGVAPLRHRGGAPLDGPPGSFNAVEAVRILPEACTTTEEAEAARAALPRRTAWLPCRSRVADARGQGSVRSPTAGSAPRIVRDASGFPVAANHDPEDGPQDLADAGAATDDIGSSIRRLRALCVIGRDADPEEAAAAARVLAFDPEGRPIGGTIWSAICDLGRRCASVRVLSGRSGDRPVTGAPLAGRAGP